MNPGSAVNPGSRGYKEPHDYFHLLAVLRFLLRHLTFLQTIVQP